MAYKTTPPAGFGIQSLASKDGAITKLSIKGRDACRTKYFRPEVGGYGYLAGEFPGGTTTVDGAPVSAEVRVLYRDPGGGANDGLVVAKVTSSESGAWQITGLDPSMSFDVVARKDGFKDVIVSGVSPTRTDIISVYGGFESNEDLNGVAGSVQLIGGLPPYSASVVAALPAGLHPAIAGRTLTIDGVSTQEGDWNSIVRVESSNGAFVNVAVDVRIEAP